jgi:DNA-binding winged helix-turn-helix (wHTH) protein
VTTQPAQYNWDCCGGGEQRYNEKPSLGCVAVASEPVRLVEPVRFGEDFELDLRAYALRRAGRPLKLERIPMDLLALLVEHRGELVTRDQIIEKIWGKDVFLDTDAGINSAIRKIRQVLKDDPEQPRFVLTVSGKGYRFVASVAEPSQPPAGPIAVNEQTPPAANLLGKKVSHYRLLQILGGGGWAWCIRQRT